MSATTAAHAGAMSMRARQLLLLARPTARASDWLAPIAGSVLAVAVDGLAGPISPSLGLTLAAIALALGVSFALDDPAAASISASPAPLALRHAVRVACALPLPAAVWLGLVVHARAADAGALTLVLAGLLASTLALAAAGSRVGESGGLIAAPTLFALVACAFALPERLSLFPPEGASSEGKGFVARWGLVLGLAACTLVAASLDPARRRAWSRRMGRISDDLKHAHVSACEARLSCRLGGERCAEARVARGRGPARH